MRWVRQTRRFGGWLALFALALQLALSFGHVHADDLAPAATQASTTAGDEGTPADHGLGHHDCDICATMAMLASLVVPLPPFVAVPAYANFIVLAETGPQIVFGFMPRQFQARAPPLAS